MESKQAHHSQFSDLATILAPLIIGKTVSSLGVTPDSLPEAGSICPFPVNHKSVDLVVCMDPEQSLRFLGHPSLQACLEAGAVIACWSWTADCDTALAAQHTAHYLRRTSNGVIISDARFSQARAVTLHDLRSGEGAALHLHLWSQAPLPALQCGLFEGLRRNGVSSPLTQMPPAASLITRDTRILSLVSRLLAIEDRTVRLRGENLKLKSELSTQNNGGQRGFFDVPKTKHTWPLAESPQRPTATLGLYDRRPDDAVIVESQAGEVFMETYALLGESPNFLAAVRFLNNRQRTLRLSMHPDVSIVIPVYGQLAYTLNCLNSLFDHNSRFIAEIIIVDDCSLDGVTEKFVPQIEGIRYHRQPRNGGFIKSCNTGGELAGGNYVIMLNSDTRVVSGWLDEIAGAFEVFPNAGLVGSKMLYPDGVLQEAGGILWRDGDAWNYGRNDDPNRPQYCYARKVDYISGCAIALPIELWRKLDGFDPHYTPAYAEDADLCQRVIASGYDIWFQPTSRVVHYEGKTSGTSTSSGIKAYQITNLKKLFVRWRRSLETHRLNGEAPFFERERYVTKRILFVDAVTPTPNQDAGSVQTVMGIRAAQLCGYKAHFVPEDNWLFEPDYTTSMQREGVDCAYAPFEVGFEAYLRRYGWLFDVVVIYRIGVLDKVHPLLRTFAPQALRLFHVADLHYLRLQRQAQLEDSEELLVAAEELKKKELSNIVACDCTITHSTAEAEILAKLVPAAPVIVWPLMVAPANVKAAFEVRTDICFLGGYRHPPNVDAVHYFVEAVLPLIHRQQPGIRFIVAGANPTPDILALASERIVVTGMIDDLADVFETSRVFVCPLRVGAGAKGKVMSALSFGVPVVSTSIGVEGAGLTPGEHVLVADSPIAMTQDVLRLYEDSALWHRLSAAGRELVQAEFSLRMGRHKLEEAVEKAYRHRLGLADE